MGILALLLFGLIAGAVAQLLMPGNDPGGSGFMGLIVTIGVGIIGAFVGGFLGSLLGFGGDHGLQHWQPGDRHRRRNRVPRHLAGGQWRRPAARRLAGHLLANERPLRGEAFSCALAGSGAETHLRAICKQLGCLGVSAASRSRRPSIRGVAALLSRLPQKEEFHDD